MTLKKSSFNPFRFTFFRTVRKNFYIPACFGIIMLLSTLVFGIGAEIRRYNDLVAIGETVATFKEYFINTRFILFNGMLLPEEFMSVIAIAVPVLTSLIIFKYMMSKKSVNVYYSFGMKRTDMFLAKYLAGAFMLSASVVLPILLSAVVNTVAFGNSKELWLSAAYISSMLIISMLFCYTVTTAVCCRNGTLIESALYSTAIILLPLCINALIEFLFAQLVYGSEIANPDWSWGNTLIVGTETVNVHFLPKLPLYDFSRIILAFSSSEIRYYSLLRRHSPQVDFEFRTPDFSGILVWVAIMIVLIAVTALTYKARKCESAGFIGADYVTKSFTVFACASFAVLIILGEISYLDRTNIGYGIVASFVIFTSIYFLAEIITVRSFKKIIKNFWRLAVIFGAYLICFVVFVTGFFGYSSRIPQKSEIESVAISTGTGDSLLYSHESGYYGVMAYTQAETPNYAMLNKHDTNLVVSGFSSDEDIDKILEIHRKLLECDKLTSDKSGINAEFGKRVIPTKIAIAYTLKNGKTMERVYSLATDEIMSALASLTETERYKEVVLSKLSPTFSSKLRNSSVSIASPNLSSAVLLPEFKSDFDLQDELCKAIKMDIAAGTLVPSYRSDKNLLGYILFGDIMVTTLGSNDDEVQYVQHESALNSIVSKKPQKISEICEEFSVGDGIRICVPVYENMQNTVAFLKSHSFDGYLKDASSPVEIRVWEIDENSKGEAYSYTNASMLLNGVWCSPDSAQGDIYLPETAKSIKISSEIKEYEDACRMVYLSCFEGYYAELIFPDGSKSYGYIPFSLIK